MAKRGRRTAADIHARFNAAISVYWRGMGLNVGVAEAAASDESGIDWAIALAVQGAAAHYGVDSLGGFISRLVTRNVSEEQVQQKVLPFTAVSSVLALRLQERWDTRVLTELHLIIPADKLDPETFHDRVYTLIQFGRGLQDISPRLPLEFNPRPVRLYPIFTFTSSAAYERALTVLWMARPGSTFPLDGCSGYRLAAAGLAPWPLSMSDGVGGNPGLVTADVTGIDLRKRRLSSSDTLSSDDLNTIFHLYDTLTL